MLTIAVEPRTQFIAYAGESERLVAAVFTESDPGLTAADFTATIDWGDGTSSPGDVTRNSDGSFDVSALKAYATAGMLLLGRRRLSRHRVDRLARQRRRRRDRRDRRGPRTRLAGVAGAYRGLGDEPGLTYVADYRAGGVISISGVPITEGNGSVGVSVPGPGGGTSHPTGVAASPAGRDVRHRHRRGHDLHLDRVGRLRLPARPGRRDGRRQLGLGADYEGVTTGTIPTAGGGTESVLYVANFASGQVETYDAATFAPVDLGPGAFTDPELPAGFAPLDVQEIDGTVYVAFAETSGAKDRPVDGAGLGFVDSFDATGHLLARFQTPGGFDAPSGIAVAPSDLGVYAGDLLVANTGDGTISVLDPNDPTAPSTSLPGALGRVAGPGGGPLAVPGLWGMTATTFQEYATVYTYLYDSSDSQLGSFFSDPTLSGRCRPADHRTINGVYGPS